MNFTRLPAEGQRGQEAAHDAAGGRWPRRKRPLWRRRPVPRPARHPRSAYRAPASVVLLGQVKAEPSMTGMPGAELIQQLLNWLSQVALWGSLFSILAAAAVWGFSQNSGYGQGAYRGKQLALAGVAGACLAGLAPTAINLLFKAAGG